jgi:hypothetical protein
LERLAAFDECERGVGSPVGGNANSLWSVPVLPVDEQGRVPVCCGFQCPCKRVCGRGIVITGLGDQSMEGIHGLVRSLELVQHVGFAAIDLGDLATGGAMQQIHHPLASVNLIRL